MGERDINTPQGLREAKKTDRSNLEFCGEFLNLVDIDLVKLDALFSILLRELLKDGRDCLAWSTPVGVKVDKEEFVARELRVVVRVI